MHDKYIMPGAIVAAAVVLALGFWATRTSDDALSVTGSARQRVTADTAKLTINWSRSVGTSALRDGYVQIKADQDAVTAFLKGKGFEGDALTVSTVSLEEPNKWNQQAPQEYTLRQYVTVQSGDVQKVTDLAKGIQPLVDRGVLAALQPVEYYYSKLADVRVQLLGDAVKDARDRADRIATSGGQQVRSLKSAAMGVVQVLPVSSTEVSDYGAYDTTSIEKEVMVTVKTVFTIH